MKLGLNKIYYNYAKKGVYVRKWFHSRFKVES